MTPSGRAWSGAEPERSLSRASHGDAEGRNRKRSNLLEMLMCAVRITPDRRIAPGKHLAEGQGRHSGQNMPFQAQGKLAGL